MMMSLWLLFILPLAYASNFASTSISMRGSVSMVTISPLAGNVQLISKNETC